ncbi:MAG: PilZ domain-containing protein [Sandaracinaceae bacterium]|nr:PilZ domain-containing protein [Sandaracinaceae bacterium]
MSVEHRRHERYAVEISAEVTVGVETVAAATQNVSEGGAALTLDLPLDEGSTFGLTLFLTQDGIEDPDREPFESTATVQWVRPASGRYLCGIAFTTVAPAQRARLREFLSATA